MRTAVMERARGSVFRAHENEVLPANADRSGLLPDLVGPGHRVPVIQQASSSSLVIGPRLPSPPRREFSRVGAIRGLNIVHLGLFWLVTLRVFVYRVQNDCKPLDS